MSLGLITLIKLIFTRLGVLAATFGHTLPIDVPPECVIIGQHTVFANMTDARTALFDFMADSHAFLKDTSVWKESLLAGELTYDESDDELSNSTPHWRIHINVFDTVCEVKSEGMKEVCCRY